MVDDHTERERIFRERLGILQAKADEEKERERQAPLKRPHQTVFVQGQNIKIDGYGFHVEKVKPNGQVILSVIPTPGGAHG